MTLCINMNVVSKILTFRRLVDLSNYVMQVSSKLLHITNVASFIMTEFNLLILETESFISFIYYFNQSQISLILI